ncbi:MAG: hypothetical protein FWE71_04250 [Nocardioidaceae bacterium]|nr:hypothetical protein [Nocardioidaceae bacterium]MCL2612975.1 hypothetical protein [Nocardioidaceae bacterium]
MTTNPRLAPLLLTAVGAFLVVGVGIVQRTPPIVLPGVTLFLAGLLTWLRHAGSSWAGVRWHRTDDGATGLLHPLTCRMWPIFALALLSTGVQLIVAGHGPERAGGLVMALAGMLLLPDLVRTALRPPVVTLSSEGIAARSRTDRWSVPWSEVRSVTLVPLLGTPGVAVETSGDATVRRTWLLLPLGSRSRASRVIIPAALADGPGAIAAALESVASAPAPVRPALLSDVATDLAADPIGRTTI